MPSVRANKPEELRRGCAENRMSGERKTLAQTEATSRTIPACAITAVPKFCQERSCGNGIWTNL